MTKGRKMTEGQVERREALLATLRSFILPAIICVILAIGVYVIINYVNVEEEEEPVKPYAYAGDSTPIVLESKDLVLTMDPLTTGFTVKQKSTGKEWDSFAVEAESDAIAFASQKNQLQSNLLISYAVTNGLETTYDSYDFSVQNGIYDIVVEDDTIKLFYSLGKVEKEFVVPPVIREADLDALKANMTPEYRNLVSDYYKKYDINNLKKKDNKEELLESYPIMETEIIYVLRDTTENLRKQLQTIFEDAGYTYEAYLEDKELDNSNKTSDKPVFNVEMDLKLEDNDLVVTIPFSSFEYKGSTPIYTVTPLPYFGAAGKEAEGSILVPEGGGALINYNNGKTSQSAYAANVYGWDYALSRDSVVHNTRAYFNIIGQATEGSSYICILEDGASYAQIQSDIGGKLTSYNYVNAKYSLCVGERYDVGEIANSEIYVYLENLPDEKIVQRYRFIDSDDYVDMAVAYRDYLIDTYAGAFDKADDNSLPVAVEIVGAVDKVKQIMGVPVSRPLQLTTFKEAEGMITDMTNSGIDNLSVKYTGWVNGGVNQKLLDDVHIVSSLGGSSALKKLSSTASSLGVDLYLDGITQYEHQSTIFDGFFSYRDAARFLTKDRAELFQYSHVTYAAREGAKSYYLLHTGLAMKCANTLIKAANKYNTGVSFNDTGMDLSSDFYKKNTRSRESVRLEQMEMLRNLDAAGTNIMINMGNDYAIAYADMVTNMDLKGSGYTIIDREIPFYQIAIHGYVAYTGNALNVCGNDEEELLRSVEYGAGLNFTLMEESSFALQKTLYTEYYGAEYASWRERMIEICSRYNDELGHTFNQTIVNHELINDYVTCTTYEDGTKVYVNYSFSEEYTTPGGKIVKVRDYTVVK